MFKLEEVISLINQGKILILAGDEELLKQLPEGKWIGGTIPYFMAENGGLVSKNLIQVIEIPSFVKNISVKSYNTSSIHNVYRDSYDHGFSIIIIPASSETHLSFAINAPEYKDFASKPLIGWISGVFLDDLATQTPKTFKGSGKAISETDAVVIHIHLPENKYADINIINIFQQGNGDTIEFTETGFSAKRAVINGKEQIFSDYVNDNHLDVKLPLVADYNGTMINISFQSIDNENKTVKFYAPVFKGVSYKQAAPVKDYIKDFTQHLKNVDEQNIVFSCNCILNYLYSELEGKKTGNITGPITFGEIAYQLLNQTMVNLEINDL